MEVFFRFPAFHILNSMPKPDVTRWAKNTPSIVRHKNIFVVKNSSKSFENLAAATVSKNLLTENCWLWC